MLECSLIFSRIFGLSHKDLKILEIGEKLLCFYWDLEAWIADGKGSLSMIVANTLLEGTPSKFMIYLVISVSNLWNWWRKNYCGVTANNPWRTGGWLHRRHNTDSFSVFWGTADTFCCSGAAIEVLESHKHRLLPLQRHQKSPKSALAWCYSVHPWLVFKSRKISIADFVKISQNFGKSSGNFIRTHDRIALWFFWGVILKPKVGRSIWMDFLENFQNHEIMSVGQVIFVFFQKARVTFPGLVQTLCCVEKSI